MLSRTVKPEASERRCRNPALLESVDYVGLGYNRYKSSLASSIMMSYKRKRAASPIPSNQPYFVPDESESERNTKKRRTTPPPLDGRLRGMWRRTEAQTNHDDDESDWSQDADEQGVDERDGDLAAPTLQEYQSVNSLLRDLHNQSHQRARTNDTMSKLAPQNTLPTTPSPSSSKLAGLARVAGGRTPPLKHVVEDVEGVRVKEWYEDTNRLLGDLFLTRRRVITDHSETDTVDDTHG
ncbi:hypothetical protein SISSUDRAFT_1063542 [Sistotremastrum suecicum HHB10207 ss-3]|uniref:Uncharacterized protein n=1 Tax=Sistotremastrum suecicum HHB10207 ss-3 TaxID=1314776 RepID=A0A166BPS0_9AGAM|nr:hypothetical protein SISSUDRAFT_1063542 [Sistotremastrum suecicum HHB10207 ss-3]